MMTSDRALDAGTKNPTSPMADEPSPSEVGVFVLFGIWWRARLRIILLGLAGMIVAVGVVLAVIAMRSTQPMSALTLRLLFNGVERGEYPNGIRFTPADIVAAPVLGEVYRRDQLQRYVKFDDFKNAWTVINNNPALDQLRREYEGQLNARNLDPVARDRLENDYIARMNAMENGEYALVALPGGQVSSWPNDLMGKVMNDILSVWAEQSRSRGVFKFDLNVFSANLLSDLDLGRDDYLFVLDRLRREIIRVQQNLDELAAIRGARLVRVGEKRLSLGELQAALEDDLQFKIGVIQGAIYNYGLYRNRMFIDSYIENQLFHLDLEIRIGRDRLKTVEDALAVYSASRPGAKGRSEDAASAGTSSAPAGLGGGTMIPQLGESFINRVIEMSSKNSDGVFRQKLYHQAIATGRETSIIESEQQSYNRMEKAIADSAEDRPQREEMKIWVERQMSTLITSLKSDLQMIQLLHAEISRQDLEPASVYLIAKPATQGVLSVISVTKIGAIAAAAWMVYVGGLLVMVAWRGVDARTGLVRTK
jgi:hypothetical protein